MLKPGKSGSVAVNVLENWHNINTKFSSSKGQVFFVELHHDDDGEHFYTPKRHYFKREKLFFNGVGGGVGTGINFKFE